MSVSSERVCEIQQDSWGSGGAFGFSQREIKFFRGLRALATRLVHNRVVYRDIVVGQCSSLWEEKSRYEVVESF